MILGIECFKLQSMLIMGHGISVGHMYLVTESGNYCTVSVDKPHDKDIGLCVCSIIHGSVKLFCSKLEDLM
jgi:hypothetical protein